MIKPVQKGHKTIVSEIMGSLNINLTIQKFTIGAKEVWSQPRVVDWF